jgi:hypothetical protein
MLPRLGIPWDFAIGTIAIVAGLMCLWQIPLPRYGQSAIRILTAAFYITFVSLTLLGIALAIVTKR